MKVIDINELRMRIELADSEDAVKALLLKHAFDFVDLPGDALPGDVMMKLEKLHKQEFWNSHALVLDTAGVVHEFDRTGRECAVSASKMSLPLIRRHSTIKHLNVPEPVARILSYAFYDYVVETISLPSTLVRVDAHAFDSVHRLKKVVLPKSVKHLGHCAFNLSDVEEICFEGRTWNEVRELLAGQSFGQMLADAVISCKEGVMKVSSSNL